MARDEARVFTAIWQDTDFLDYSPTQQRLYLFLLSQPDLSYCGVIALRERRWAKKAKGLTVESIREDLAALARNPSPMGSANPSGNPSPKAVSGPLLVVDEDHEEVLIRSFIRRDGLWKQPNLLKSAREAARLVQSPEIRRALLGELHRIPVEKSESVHVKKVMAEFIAELAEGSEDPFPDPGDGAYKGSGNPSANSSGNPSPDPSQEKGDGYGEVVEGSPHSGTPTSVPPSAGADAPRQSADPAWEPTTTDELVADWLDHVRKRPPGQVIGQVGKHVKAMLSEGIDPADIRQGIAIWATKGLHPSALPSVVNEAMNARPVQRAAGNSPGPRPALARSTTDERVAQAQALKAKFAATPPPTIAGEIAR